MRLIGLNGFKTAGKDTCYELIAEHSCGSVKRLAFADKMKIAAAKSIGYSGSDHELINIMNAFKQRGKLAAKPSYPRLARDGAGWLPENIPSVEMDGRTFLQNFGHFHREVFGDNFWVDLILPEAIEHTPGMTDEDHANVNRLRLLQRHPNVDKLVVTDVRYPNEAERILSLGGEVYEITRINVESDGHETEQPLDRSLVTAQLRNNSTRAYLLDQLRRTDVLD
jgi:hypothetical protein